MFCRTHRVDVQSHGAGVHGINCGQAAGQRRHQRVVGGVDRRFAFWVLEGEVGVGEAVRLGEKLRGKKKKDRKISNTTADPSREGKRAVFPDPQSRKKYLCEADTMLTEVELRFLQMMTVFTL